MAEQIKLAQFELDTSRLEKSLDSLQDKYFNLKKEQKGYSDQSKEAQKQINDLVKVQKLLSESSGDNTKEIEKYQKEIDGLVDTQKGLFKEEQKVINQQKSVRKEIGQTTKQLNSYTDSESKLTSLIDLGNEALKRNINNKNDAKEANIALNEVSNQLNPSIEEEARLLEEVNAQIDKNTEFIKENTSEIGKQKINIGNYKDDIVEAAQAINPLNGGIAGFSARAKEAGGVGKLMATSLKSITKASLAFIATPLGALLAVLVGAFALVKNAMNRSEKATNKISKVFTIFSGITNKLLKYLEPLGDFLIDGLVAGFELAGKAAEKSIKLISTGLRFLGFDSASKNVAKFGNDMVQASKDAQVLADAEANLVVQQRKSQLIQLDYQKEAEKARQIRDNTNLTIKERIKANEDLSLVLQKQLLDEMRIAESALLVANLRIQTEGQTKDALDAQAEALTTIADIQERITGQESEQLTNRVSLQKEASDKAKEFAQQEADRKQAEIDSIIENSRQELDFFVATQGFKKKSSEETYEFNKKLLEKELADAKLNYEKGKISKTEYETEKLNIGANFAQSNAELAIENAELEFEALLSGNEKILSNTQFLSEEQFKIKQEALTKNLEAEQEYQRQRLENGVINEAEYNTAINEINETNRLANEQLQLERNQAENEKKLLDIETKKLIQQDNFIAQAELEKQQNAILRQQEIDNAEQTGASIADINTKYAELNNKIEQQKNANKVGLAANAFSSLATILGEESKAGKAAAIAQTTITTYQSAISAFNSLSGIPIVGPVLGGIAAAAAVASGLAAVKKITSTKTATANKKPSYARGVIGLRGAGDGTSDDINAKLSAGESVITARATQMFPNELSAINQAGGGVGLNASSNVTQQNEIQKRADDSKMLEAMAEAVAIGAEKGTNKGSQEGMIGLSEHREIIKNAQF